jgi:hypothetical protein
LFVVGLGVELCHHRNVGYLTMDARGRAIDFLVETSIWFVDTCSLLQITCVYMSDIDLQILCEVCTVLSVIAGIQENCARVYYWSRSISSDDCDWQKATTNSKHKRKSP